VTAFPRFMLFLFGSFSGLDGWSRRFHLFLLALGVAAVLPIAVKAQDAPAGPRSVWNIEQRGAFVMSSLYDGKRFYWFWTEDRGVALWIARCLKSVWRIWIGHQSHHIKTKWAPQLEAPTWS
jgi:hypothetical protein